jgi:dTMP kinase
MNLPPSPQLLQRFVTFEGGEGAGKSTQAKLLADRLAALGQSCVLTREPGGVAQAEELRGLLLHGARDRWSVASEALLMIAARVEHWRLKIRPALERGDWVICDRFADSTMAYQGAAGGLGLETVRRLHAAVLPGVAPGITLILDLPPESGLARARARAAAAAESVTRFEHADLAYHTALAQAFRAIAVAEPGRCRVIDASGDAAVVALRIWDQIGPKVSGRP